MSIEPNVYDHETRISVLEHTVKDLTPRLETVEQIAPLKNQLDSLQQTVRHLTKTLEEKVGDLSSAITDGLSRITDINEENMRRTAAQAEEKHQAELKASAVALEAAKAEAKRRQEEVAKLELEKEDRAWQKQMQRGATWIACIMGGVAGLAALFDYVRQIVLGH